MPYDKNVFINCPFDAQYFILLKPILFTIVYAGFNPRIALENSDSGTPRLEKLTHLIRQSKYSIHDLSRIQAEKSKEFFRLNMPFELGLDYGAKSFDLGLKDKKFLILETEKFNYMKALSDINGLDIKSHFDKPEEVINCVTSWFIETVGITNMESPKMVWYEYSEVFNAYLFDKKIVHYRSKYPLKKATEFAKDEISTMPLIKYIKEVKKFYNHHS